MIMHLIVLVCFNADYFNCLINTSKAFIFSISFHTVVAYENSSPVKCSNFDMFYCSFERWCFCFVSVCLVLFLSVIQAAVRSP